MREMLLGEKGGLTLLDEGELERDRLREGGYSGAKPSTCIACTEFGRGVGKGGKERGFAAEVEIGRAHV